MCIELCIELCIECFCMRVGTWLAWWRVLWHLYLVYPDFFGPNHFVTRDTAWKAFFFAAGRPDQDGLRWTAPYLFYW